MSEVVLPRIIIQRGSALGSLLDVLSDLGVSKVYLIADEESRMVINNLIRSFESKGIEHGIGNLEGRGIPDEIEIKALASLIEEFKPDAILAIGSVKAVFTSKLVGVLTKRPLLNLKDITPVTRISLEFEKPLLVMVPLCAGWATGCLRTAVYRDAENNLRPLVNKSFAPHAIVLDPNLTLRLTKRTFQNAVGGLLAQAMESYLYSFSSDLTQSLALHSIRLAFEYSERAFNDPTDVEAWERIQQASLMSGVTCGAPSLPLSLLIGLSISETLRIIPSGIASGIILPKLLMFYEQYNEDVRERLLKVKSFLEALLSLEYKESLSEHLDELYSRIGFPRHFSELAINKNNYETAIDKVLESLSSGLYRFAFSPVKPAVEHIIDVLKRSYE